MERAEHVFFFPPYSSLYWCMTQDEGYFDIYMDAKRYFIERACSLGATVFDFQGEELTADLDNYKDITHYSPAISDMMVRCFAARDKIVDADGIDRAISRTRRLASEFRARHGDLFDPSRD